MERIYRHNRSALACVAASATAVNAGFAISFSSIAMRDLQADVTSIHFTTKEATWFGSLLPLMAICGSLLSGPLMDHLGRRAAILTIVVCFLLCWISMFFSSGYSMLFAGRGLSGLATGMTTAVIPVYISEVSPACLRGAMGGVFSVALASGLPLGYSAGLFFTWRKVAEIGAILACVTFFAAFLLTESPYWLIRQGRLAEGSECLQNLRGKGYQVVNELKDIQCLQEELSESVSMQDVMSRSFLKPLGIGVALMVFQQLSGVNAIFFYAHDIFRRANFHNETLASLLVSLMQVISVIIVTFFIDKIGRKKLFILSAFGTTCCHVVVGACMYVLSESAEKTTVNLSVMNSSVSVSSTSVTSQSNVNDLVSEVPSPGVEVATWLSLIFVMLYVTSYSIGLGPLPFIVFSELLPQRGRGVAGGVCTMSNWLCAFVVTKCFFDLVELVTASGVFWMFSFVCLMSSVFVWRCVPETRGKTLSEIQSIFMNNNNTAKRTKGSMFVSSRKIVDQMIASSPLARSKKSSESMLDQSQELI